MSWTDPIRERIGLVEINMVRRSDPSQSAVLRIANGFYEGASGQRVWLNRGLRLLDYEQSLFRGELVSPGEAGGTLGSVQIANRDGALDYLWEWTCEGQDISIYAATGPAVNKTLIATAVGEGFEFDGRDSVRVVIKDDAEQLRQPLQVARYTGTGSAARYLDGEGGGYFEAENGIDAASPIYRAGYFGTCWARVYIGDNPGATAAEAIVFGTGIGKLRMDLNGGSWIIKAASVSADDAGGSGSPTLSTATSVNCAGQSWFSRHRWYWVMAQPRRGKIWVGDGMIVRDVSSTYTQTSTTFAPAPLRSGSFGGDTGNWMVSSVRVTDKLLPESVVHDRRWTLPDVQDPNHDMLLWLSFSEGTGADTYDEVSALKLTAVASGSNPSWNTAGDGSRELAGKTRPVVAGPANNVLGVLVDPQREVYQLAEGAIERLDSVRVRGAAVTAGTEQSSLEALGAATVTAGTYDWCRTDAEGTFLRLGSAPDGDLTWTGLGMRDDQGDYHDDFRQLFKMLLIRFAGFAAGGQRLDGDFDTATVLTPSGILQHYPTEGMGWSATSGDTITLGQMMGDLCETAGGYWHRTSAGKLALGILGQPMRSSASVVLPEIDLDVEALSYSFARSGTPVKRSVVGYQRNGHRQRASELAGSLYTNDPDLWWFVQGPGNTTQQVEENSAHPYSVDLEARSYSIQTWRDAQAHARRELKIWGRPGRILTVTSAAKPFEWELGQTVLVYSARHGMHEGLEMVVASRRYDIAGARFRSTVALWAPDKAVRIIKTGELRRTSDNSIRVVK